MARELVLVPKMKYERLLEQVKEPEQNEQSGGNVEHRGVNSPIPSIKGEHNISNEKPSNSDSKDESEESTEDVVKPRLYVHKPLSDMPFDSRMSTISGGKKKNTKKTFNRRELARSREKKNIAKTRWINYVV